MKTPADLWMGFGCLSTDEAARMAFTARYGCEPERIIRSRGCVLAGPIPVAPPGRDPSPARAMAGATPTTRGGAVALLGQLGLL